MLERAGQTEAAVDLARLAGLNPAGVICEVMNDDGTMARVPELVEYCARHGLSMITVADLIAYRRRHDKLVERVVATRLPTTFGDFEAVGYRSLVDDKHHVALVKGEVAGRADVLVRVHSECLTGDVFHSLRCDCGEQLESALSMIEREGQGVLLYLSQEGRGIGLLNKLRAYRLQEDGLDTVEANERLGLPADLRDYGIGAQILVDLGLGSIRILTNNPKKIRGLEGYGLSVSGQIPIEHAPNEHNEAYLRTKAQRMGHTLHHQGLNLDEELLHDERTRARRRRGAGAASRGRSSGERAASRSSVARFYEDLAERLVAGARAAFAAAGQREVEVFDVPGAFELPLAAELRRAQRALRRRGLPRRGDPRRDRPLRLRLRAGRRGRDARAARDGRPLRLRRADLRDDGAGARARRRRQARPGRARRRGGRADGGAARSSLQAARLRRSWQRYVTAAARGRRSARAAATRWSRPSGASTRTCRRCGSSSARRPSASTCARAA